MNRFVKLGILFFPLIVLAGWVLMLTIQRQTGQEVKVVVTGYDPRDILSGHYIQYTIDWDKTDCHQFETGGCPTEEFCVQEAWGRQCRFYVPEQDARRLDQLFTRHQENQLGFEVVYAYQVGLEPLAKKLLINGVEWMYYRQ